MFKPKWSDKCFNENVRVFFYEKGSWFSPPIIPKKAFYNGQVLILKYGLKPVFLLFNL